MNKKYFKNFDKPEYKTSLTMAERVALVQGAVSYIRAMYDAGVYGLNEYYTRLAFISICTNIEIKEAITETDADGNTVVLKDGATKEQIYDFLFNTKVYENVIAALGTGAYSIIAEINEAVRYTSSTNPETKKLMIALTGLIEVFNNNSEVFKDIAKADGFEGMIKALIGASEGETETPAADVTDEAIEQ